METVMSDKYVQVEISDETLRLLEKKKLNPEEPLNDVIDRLLKSVIER
jgi:hypothetical protein